MISRKKGNNPLQIGPNGTILLFLSFFGYILAIFRTWLEPSKEVASFIYSTLKTLTMTEVPELRLVGEQARGIITLVKKNIKNIFFFQKQYLLILFCFYF